MEFYITSVKENIKINSLRIILYLKIHTNMVTQTTLTNTRKQLQIYREKSHL